jgi:hypothetical protein
MAKQKKKSSQRRAGSTTSTETRASEALTVFWAVTVLTLLGINLVALFAHTYVLSHPAAEKMVLLKGLLLFTGSLMGSVSLVLLPILYRVRQVPPPRGLAVFGACVAIAPIAAVLLSSMR